MLCLITSASLKQILLKLNRLEDDGYGHLKLSHVCEACKQIGHNARTYELKNPEHNSDNGSAL